MFRLLTSSPADKARPLASIVTPRQAHEAIVARLPRTCTAQVERSYRYGTDGPGDDVGGFIHWTVLLFDPHVGFARRAATSGLPVLPKRIKGATAEEAVRRALRKYRAFARSRAVVA